MKKITTIASLIGMTLLCNNAFASQDIKVHGVIGPNACTISIVGGGADLDWGIKQHADLKQNELNTLEAKKATIAVNCPSEQSIAIWATDPNADSAMVGVNNGTRVGHAVVERIFGLGVDPVTGNNLGNFTLNPISTTVDGKKNSTTFGYTAGATHSSTAFAAVNSSDWSYNKNEDWTPLDATTSQPAKGKAFTWEFDVEPQLNKGSMITSAQKVDWKGTAQVNVRYF